MNHTFRIGTTEDIPQLISLGLDSYGQYRNELTSENWKKMEDSLSSPQTYLDLLSSSTCFICELKGTIIGMAYIILSGNPTDIYQSNWSYIRFVGVHPNSKGLGIGKELIQKCINFALKNNETVIALHTSEMMHAARSIYKKAGFKLVRKLNPRFGKNYDLFLLQL